MDKKTSEPGNAPPPETRTWEATAGIGKGTMGQVGYTLTIRIDELFDDSPSYGTPVTLTERAAGTEAGEGT